ncbi:peroxiredoxin [Filimonas zeae]|uniref:Thiol:disulfide interchange protein n=1 Tax=Filimonas zeae TaxID=1737353 RepID=A0A917MWU0_9BACT|nr:TlpA disulfide reductase family protein [Filimonas zeae]MDR6340073.1 peroxiredoxin [Filimonas zeae]GGH71004.1 thiol:disulfide interchange protein [Filimonas zeae]
MKKIATFLAVLLLPCLTIAQIKEKGAFVLNVQIQQANPNVKLYLAYQFDGKRILDSADNKNGTYTFAGTVERPLHATLVSDHNQLGIQQLMKSSAKGASIDAMKIYLHPDTINLKTEKLVQNGVFPGSGMNNDNESLKGLLKAIDDERKAISQQLRSRGFIISTNDNTSRLPISEADSIQIRALVTRLDSLGAATRPVYKKFITDNPNSYIALQSLIMYAGSFPDVFVIEPMFNRLSAEVRNTSAGREFARFLTDRENILPGTKAPGFTQSDTEGKPVSLSSFNGKYVLIDFWASWCAPCRAANPELVRLYNDFKDRNFTILGVSLDEQAGKKLWLKAIKDDQLTWTQVSDLKHWDNSVVKLYSVRAIPQSFLIDPDGIIVARGLNLAELREKLQEILK